MLTRVPEITISNAALQHIVGYLSKEGAHRGIRLSVKKTGCSGYAYAVEYVSESNDQDWLMTLTDGYWLCVDAASYPVLKGTHIDYVRQGLNGKLIYSNPNQAGQCGCGESFTVE
jgi:iron-sulfur cluster assembly accessory protein